MDANRLKQAGLTHPCLCSHRAIRRFTSAVNKCLHRQDCEVLAQRRDALRRAETLFGMEVTPYPALAEVRRASGLRPLHPCFFALSCGSGQLRVVSATIRQLHTVLYLQQPQC